MRVTRPFTRGFQPSIGMQLSQTQWLMLPRSSRSRKAFSAICSLPPPKRQQLQTPYLLPLGDRPHPVIFREQSALELPCYVRCPAAQWVRLSCDGALPQRRCHCHPMKQSLRMQRTEALCLLLLRVTKAMTGPPPHKRIWREHSARPLLLGILLLRWDSGPHSPRAANVAWSGTNLFPPRC